VHTISLTVDFVSTTPSLCLYHFLHSIPPLVDPRTCRMLSTHACEDGKHLIVNSFFLFLQMPHTTNSSSLPPIRHTSIHPIHQTLDPHPHLHAYLLTTRQCPRPQPKKARPPGLSSPRRTPLSPSGKSHIHHLDHR
jgi:hypothetical protein